MKHRISAGALVFHEDRILMVRHQRVGRYDFWVPPGGGVAGTETIFEAAEREVREETAIRTRAERLLYIEELWQPTYRHVKFWVQATYLSGEIDASGEEATREYIIEAAWLTRGDLPGRVACPPIIRDRVWEDAGRSDVAPSHLGLREMAFF